jgi:hypothetical protein
LDLREVYMLKPETSYSLKYLGITFLEKSAPVNTIDFSVD